MNRKGFMGITTILIILALTLGLMYTMAEEQGLDKENITETFTTNIRNFTSNFSLNLEIEGNEELGNALNYYTDGMVRAGGELGVWTAKFVEDNPQAPYKLLLILLLLSFCAPIFIVLFKILVIIFLLTKESLQNRREKRELKRISDK